MVKVRKISNYTGLALSKWETFKTEEEARIFIENNQSFTGAFHWIAVSKFTVLKKHE